MRIGRGIRRTAAALLGCQAAWSAALDIDDADGPRMTGQVLGAWLRQGFTGDPAEAWFIPGTTPGTVVGWYRLELPDLENRDRAELLIVVDPAARRTGLGRTLLRHAAERAAAAGRSVLGGEVRDGSAATRSPSRPALSQGWPPRCAGSTCARWQRGSSPAYHTVELTVCEALA